MMLRLLACLEGSVAAVVFLSWQWVVFLAVILMISCSVLLCDIRLFMQPIAQVAFGYNMGHHDYNDHP